jgi:phosphoenolpyruvate carboxylase
MFGNPVGNTLSLTKLLSGTSKFLGIVNQAIPIYKEVKPMVNNFRKVLSVVKEFNKTNTTSNNKKTIDVTKKTVNKNYLQSNSNPVFFQ